MRWEEVLGAEDKEGRGAGRGGGEDLERGRKKDEKRERVSLLLIAF